MTDLWSDPEPLIRRVYAYVALRLGEGPAAEEATARTLLAARDLDPPPATTAADTTIWLIGLARRTVAELERDPEVDPLPAAGHDAAGAGAALADALDRLDRRDRELVALRTGADLSPEQIATLLGLRVETVEAALARVLEQLRLLYEARKREVR